MLHTAALAVARPRRDLVSHPITDEETVHALLGGRMSNTPGADGEERYPLTNEEQAREDNIFRTIIKLAGSILRHMEDRIDHAAVKKAGTERRKARRAHLRHIQVMKASLAEAARKMQARLEEESKNNNNN